MMDDHGERGRLGGVIEDILMIRKRGRDANQSADWGASGFIGVALRESLVVSWRVNKTVWRAAP